jgi:biotin carboxyl carrier protein
MAAMNGMRVEPAAGSALDGDDARNVPSAADGGPRVEPRGRGRAVVHGTSGDDHAAWIGTDRLASGSRARTIEVVVDGWRFELEVEDAARAELRRRATKDRDASIASGPLEIRAMIPGRVAAVRVTAGDVVEAGAALLVVEAMKMQNELRAPRAGRVERLVVSAGETIDLGDLLVVLG